VSAAAPASFDLRRGLASTVELAGGVSLPVLGFGTWQLAPGAVTRAAVGEAIRVGYRHIDTAALYGNEADVGSAVRASGLPRSEIHVTTKLWNDDHGYERALAAFARSEARLGLGPVDLYLIHWPVRGEREASWKALVTLVREGRARAIGVSNFTVEQLEALATVSDVVPAVDQVELSPFLAQPALRAYCRAHRIQLEAYSPLTRGRRLDDPVVAAIAARHAKSPAQVLLRWALEHAIVPLPKSATPARIRENADLFDFALAPEELAQLDRLDTGWRIGADPARFG
jgi:diketogulonate reductase-like aldo/keto reductase